MKKCCKHVDITDRALISRAVRGCLKDKMGRPDTLRMFHEYTGVPLNVLRQIAEDKQYQLFNGIIETVIDGIREEIIQERYRWKPIWYTWRKENNKLRRIGIQDIKQQLYDYIAVEGLAEVLQKKIGYYQCAAIPEKGQVMGMRAIRRWIRNKAMRYAWKGDACHYYENIDIDRLKELLERYVDNKALLHLVYSLIDSFERGLSIGSFLSQYLANFYMSFAYHFASEQLFKYRKRKNGTIERVHLIHHIIIYMDDILFIGSSLKDMKMAVKRFRSWTMEELKIEIKPEEDWIDLRTGYIDMMGYLISRDKVIVRPRIFRRYRKVIKKVKKSGIITIKQAGQTISRDGWMTNAQCSHFRKRTKADRIVVIAKEMISHDDYAVLLPSADHYHHPVAKREAGRNRADRRRGNPRKHRRLGSLSGKPVRINRNADLLSVPWEPVPDSV